MTACRVSVNSHRSVFPRRVKLGSAAGNIPQGWVTGNAFLDRAGPLRPPAGRLPRSYKAWHGLCSTPSTPAGRNPRPDERDTRSRIGRNVRSECDAANFKDDGAVDRVVRDGFRDGAVDVDLRGRLD